MNSIRFKAYYKQMGDSLESRLTQLKLVSLTVAALTMVFLTTACGDGFKSFGIERLTPGTYDLVPFSESELTEKLSAQTLDPSLLPTTEKDMTELVKQCPGRTSTTGSLLVAKYLGLGRSNSVYGTVLDLCYDEVPSVTIYWLEEGSPEIQFKTMVPTLLGSIRIKSKDHSIYIFSQQISAAASQGVFWITVDSRNQIGGTLELIGARTPYFYQLHQATTTTVEFQ